MGVNWTNRFQSVKAGIGFGGPWLLSCTREAKVYSMRFCGIVMLRSLFFIDLAKLCGYSFPESRSQVQVSLP
jgi:hypothetical protein